ncbi:MAG: hypothetical protein WBX14_02185 [Candidatus Udaeobacter sp.]
MAIFSGMVVEAIVIKLKIMNYEWSDWEERYRSRGTTRAGASERGSRARFN